MTLPIAFVLLCSMALRASCNEARAPQSLTYHKYMSQQAKTRFGYRGCGSGLRPLIRIQAEISEIKRTEIPPSVFRVIDIQEVQDPTAQRERKRHLERRDEFLLNKGLLVDTVRDEIPQLLDEAPSLELFREDTVLHLELGRTGIDFEIVGKEQCKTWLERMRWTARLALGWVEISRVDVRPDVDPMSPYVRVRWSMVAYPRLFMQNAPIRVDLLSIFELDGEGLVKKHTITDVDQSSLRLPAVIRSLFSPAIAGIDPVAQISSSENVEFM
mmetsp:Transcript_17916/g.33977  ORF Transcript_17916/g.33977 Transcript_17916/m.33977 type:complete len:271 (-) Transcript_17916:264-1076(-)|eukprot:CAMPEP_0170168750 /NCGR_PEP_ID=MMETSP0040_2-20121228/1699_1 /TAXON_ID=641309 /ORGANISM="Lotharella oceanica, Strain CCMP622" /LENGTH=270 /DNA_ID=CAMNT_0010407089 /DNA_START=88 /DNA_END=900 /DNA_ORIENTATION=-